MHVEHLLKDETLGLRLLWAADALLEREISGVTVTDLENPARFVRPGEVVLSGLVWWTPRGGPGRAERFVSALRGAGAAALLAGEETHGAVPEVLVEACARHALPVAAVPAHVMFRSVTDTVYLQQWGELSRHHALPENARIRLSRLLARGAGPQEIVEAAFAHLGRAAEAYVLTPAGRTVAATAHARPLAAVQAAALVHDSDGAALPVEADLASPYERRHLYLPDRDAVPPRLLQEVAAILGRCQESGIRDRSTGVRAADGLGALLCRETASASALEAALRDCGLPARGPYRVVVAGTSGEGAWPAEGALAEVTALVATGPAAVGVLPDGTAFSVTAGPAGPADEVWQRVAACDPGVALHGGTGSPAASAAGLGPALAEARFALDAARGTAPGSSLLTDATALTTLDALLAGIPATVRGAFSGTVLAPLLDAENASATPLLETLRTFLACDGSWARTAQALHLHVNTVHYRVQRIELFTGRDLSRLADRLDLWAALLCHDRSAGI
ncbi:helix-turn-helix domain-containing protein [Streptomyces sp. cg35]|uniref:helix-turn-helix domain-containing protein n=1 Tax=Streptomyces sp. cg35 TaxID=3421650 RepID=UPI003D164529